jgi:hypothetical protein
MHFGVFSKINPLCNSVMADNVALAFSAFNIILQGAQTGAWDCEMDESLVTCG